MARSRLAASEAPRLIELSRMLVSRNPNGVIRLVDGPRRGSAGRRRESLVRSRSAFLPLHRSFSLSPAARS